MFDMVLLEFFTQGSAIDAEAGSGSRLVVITMSKYCFQHRLLDFRNDGVEQVTG